jgi:hypothetical protein
MGMRARLMKLHTRLASPLGEANLPPLGEANLPSFLEPLLMVLLLGLISSLLELL